MGVLLTMYIFDYTGCQPMTRQRDKNLTSRLTPDGVMGYTPASDGTKEKTQIILPSKLFCWGHVATQPD